MIKELLLGNKERKEVSSKLPPLKYPNAIFIPGIPKLYTVGKYKNNFPEGAIIHYTSGWQKQTGEEAIRYALAEKFCYFFIDQNGVVFQQFDLSNWGFHAGQSVCPVTGTKGVSTKFVGIEVACAGKLEKGKTWFGQQVKPEQIRKAGNNFPQGIRGEYQMFTVSQEKSLMELCVWLCLNGAKKELFFGHYEVTSRKEDPGASLSLTMPGFRTQLAKELEKCISSSSSLV